MTVFYMLYVKECNVNLLHYLYQPDIIFITQIHCKSNLIKFGCIKIFYLLHEEGYFINSIQQLYIICMLVTIILWMTNLYANVIIVLSHSSICIHHYNAAES